MLAAAVIVVVLAAVPVAAAIATAVAVAAAEEQQNQNDDPPAAIATPVVTAHNRYLRFKFSERSVAHSMLFRRAIFVQAGAERDSPPLIMPGGDLCGQ